MTTMSDNGVKLIDVGRDFTRFPAGRYSTDGKFSGQKFRDQFLIPALENYSTVRVELDSTMGYGSSFLEEAFGGLVRAGLNADDLLSKLELISRDSSLIDEINEYIATA
ncbi:STAS-like domain-containing protein [Citromicrobium bathyomarinum]